MNDAAVPTFLGASAPELERFEALISYREREERELEDSSVEPGISGLSVAPSAAAMAAAARVSPRAFKLIVDYETGGRAFYDRVIKSRPIWPKGSSGITIGFGYDLGYVELDEFRRDWAALGPSERAALEACIGFHSGKDSAGTMNSLLAQVGEVEVPWDMAEAEFRAQTLPKFAGLTENALPDTDRLSGDCFGALVSLTFNRGASYGKAHNPAKDPLDRYREMRAIKAAMSEGRFEGIPREIKAMIRIWEGTNIAEGMRRRRVDEAELFLSGLAVGVAPLTVHPDAASMASTQTDQGTSDEDFWTEMGEEELAAMAADGFAIGIASAGATWAIDEKQPDYAHLGPGLTQDVPFTLTGEDLALLARLNDFDLDILGNDAPVLFGLRGAGIVQDHTAEGGIVLLDQRPDHATPRCTIGVWNRRDGLIAVFPGSTVPNQKAVAQFQRDGSAGNLLATGLYNYVCGPHITSRTTPGCFLLRMPDMSKREVVVRRSKNDLSYQKSDLVDKCAPGDNIHPTFFSQPTGFSSLGCQTVVGSFKDNVHSGPWASFRQAAGFTDTDGEPGKGYLYILLTGAEARIASRMRLDGLANDAIATHRLRRVRFGSTGAAANRLQTSLNLPEPDGRMGPFTTESLHRFQAGLPGSSGSDGIYTPELDATLGWQVFDRLGA